MLVAQLLMFSLATEAELTVQCLMVTMSSNSADGLQYGNQNFYSKHLLGLHNLLQ